MAKKDAEPLKTYRFRIQAATKAVTVPIRYIVNIVRPW